MMKALIERGADVNAIDPGTGDACLHKVMTNKSIYPVDEFIQVPGSKSALQLILLSCFWTCVASGWSRRGH